MAHLSLKNGCEMFYELHGDADRTIMMIHGLGGCGLFWTPHVRPLVDAGWRVLIVDWPGNGRSGNCAEFSLDAYVDSFIEVAERTGSMKHPLVLCGHSAGGALVQMMYHRAPERIAAIILLQTSSHFMDRRIKPFVNMVLPAYTAAVFHPAVKKVSKTATEFARGLAEPMFDEEDPSLIFLRIAAFAANGENAAAETRAFADIDIEAAAGDISVPALVIGGRIDPVVPLSRSRALHRSVPGSELRVIERFGHNAALFFARETNEMILEFLSRRFPG